MARTTETKQSRAEYFRQYRLKKQQKLEKQTKTTQESKRKEKASIHMDRVFIFGFCAILTLFLTYLAADSYQGSTVFRFFVASLGEFSLIALVFLEGKNLFQCIIRVFLLAAMSLYTLAPAVIKPIVDLEKAKEERLLLEQKLTILDQEQKTKEDQVLRYTETGRLSMANKVANDVAEVILQKKAVAQQFATVATTAQNPMQTWVLSLQRLLLAITNLFLLHVMFSKEKHQKKIVANATTTSATFPQLRLV
jgi:hypothetical protein